MARRWGLVLLCGPLVCAALKPEAPRRRVDGRRFADAGPPRETPRVENEILALAESYVKNARRALALGLPFAALPLPTSAPLPAAPPPAALLPPAAGARPNATAALPTMWWADAMASILVQLPPPSPPQGAAAQVVLASAPLNASSGLNLQLLWADSLSNIQLRTIGSSEALAGVSAVVEGLLREATRDPTEAAKVLLDAVAERAGEAVSSTVSSGALLAKADGGANSIADVLRAGCFFDAAGSPLFGNTIDARPLTFAAGPARAAPAPSGVGRSVAWLRRAAFASELVSAAYLNGPGEAAAAIRKLGCARVASGRTCDVSWHVADRVGGDGVLERHVVVRGFDASDTSGDNVELVRRTIAARPTRIPKVARDYSYDFDDTRSHLFYDATKRPDADGESDFICPAVVAHRGFLFMAERILRDVEPFLDVAPDHRLVFSGHSIGASLAILVYVLVMRRPNSPLFNHADVEVFTFAALPCLRVVRPPAVEADAAFPSGFEFLYQPLRPKLAEATEANPTVLAALGLPEQRMHCFTQPWDPLVRWYSTDDPCYPLVGDLGGDGVTLFASGPMRLLRPLIGAVLQSADEWPRVRDVYRAEAAQEFSPSGSQYLILPDVPRYVADRIMSLQIDVPEPTQLCVVAPRDFARALNCAFPLDAFSISLFPTAVRSLVHHFHDAYRGPILSLLEAEERLPENAPTDKGETIRRAEDAAARIIDANAYY